VKNTCVIGKSDALLITDIQIDFLPGGALPVAGGTEIIPVLNDYIQRFETAGNVLASRDWHPANHISFKAQGGQWPPHSVQNTKGAEFSPKLKLPKHTIIISKATDPNHEAYSAFDGTNLLHELGKLGIKRLFIGGLATDYCVLNTVLDAREFSFETLVLMDATRGIDVKPGDVDRAIKAMVKSGAEQVTVADFPDFADDLPIEEETSDALSEKSSMLNAGKKKARMRSKGSNGQVKTEHKS
jgi:nicotinamidase/pyrazinamidase